MNPIYVNPAKLGKPVGFSHGVVYSGGRLLFLGGQNGGEGPFATQFERALERILEVVREAGGRPEHIGVLNIFVTSRKEYGAARKRIGAAWKRLMGRHYPAMAMYEVKSLWEPSAKVELEGIAVIP